MVVHSIQGQPKSAASHTQTNNSHIDSALPPIHFVVHLSRATSIRTYKHQACFTLPRTLKRPHTLERQTTSKCNLTHTHPCHGTPAGVGMLCEMNVCWVYVTGTADAHCGATATIQSIINKRGCVAQHGCMSAWGWVSLKSADGTHTPLETHNTSRGDDGGGCLPQLVVAAALHAMPIAVGTGLGPAAAHAR